jgi:ABC-2 type transport system permease protein
MNIFLRELKANLRSLLIWVGIMILFVAAGMSKFAAYEGNPQMLEVLAQMPPALMAAFSMQAFNLTSLSGFFGVFFTFFALILGISGAMWGSDIISKEERDRTVEFSLTLPVTRSRVVTAKTLAALVNCAGLLLVTWGASIVFARPYQPDAEFYNFLRLSMLALFVIQLVFLAIGVFLGCAMKQYKRAGSVAVSILLGTYFLSVITDMDEKLHFLKYFTPFKYFDPALLLHESKIDLAFVGLSLAIVALSLAGAYLTYTRRDLYI